MDFLQSIITVGMAFMWLMAGLMVCINTEERWPELRQLFNDWSILIIVLSLAWPVVVLADALRRWY